MRYCLLLLGSLLAGILAKPVQAQQAKAVSAGTLTRQDTAYAVHELFVARRTGGALLTGFGGVFTGLYAYGMFDTPPQSAGEAALVTGVASVVAFMPLGVGIGKLHRYSRAREEQVLSSYAATGQLARKYRRRLRGNFRPVPGAQTWPIAVSEVAAVSSPLPAPEQVVTPPSGAANYTLADSLDAVAALFQNKRLGGQIPVLAVLPAARLLSGSSEADGQYNNSTGQFEKAQPSTGAVVAGLALAIGGVTYMFVHNAPYTNAKLTAIRTASESGVPIPAHIRALLKPKHFEQGRELHNRLLRKAARKKK